MMFGGKSIITGKPVTGGTRLVVLGLIGAIVGGLLTQWGNPLPLTPREELVPAAYRIAKFPGGTALRLAMVHDVIHERYLRHGAAWYEKRNDNARAVIAEERKRGGEPTEEMFAAMDDLAVGLDVLHKDDEAVEVMREKLKLLGAPAAKERDVKVEGADGRENLRVEYEKLLGLAPLTASEMWEYTGEANLGTALIHGSFAAAMMGNVGARERFREGLAHIQRSVAINPLAHFGRENWQAVVVAHFLACEDHPELLAKYTMVGDVMDAPEANTGKWGRHYAMMVRWARDPDMTPGMRGQFRGEIPTAGINPEWASIVKPVYTEPMPFDEPVLGLIGMWTLGGGPSPYSAMALGRIMENIGQRQIAWNAYERAMEMQEKFSPVAEVRGKLVAACRVRQVVIAGMEAAVDSAAWETSMRKTHVGELAWGQAYQKAYQDYEAAQIRAGVMLGAAGFYDGFFRGRESVASDPGASDEVLVIHTKPQKLIDVLPLLVVGAAACMGLGYLTERKRVARAAG